MKKFLIGVSLKGQITLPAEIRQLLGIKPKDKVVLTLDGEEIRVRAAKSRLEESYQAVPALKQLRTLRGISEISREEHAQEAAAEGLPLAGDTYPPF